MRCRDLVTLIGMALALLPSLAGAQPSTPATTALARKVFTLGGTPFVLFLPEAATVRISASENTITFDLTKGMRLERQLVLATAPREIVAGRKVLLRNGARLEYAIDDNTGGGSGGPIAALSGRMEIGAHALSVRCTDQDEGSREPDWCLRYLDRLEIVQRTP